ncbi:MAG: hypothetical protein AVDCRST_MAG56-2223 [uncultured Cytophagales bacterium]|uniref:Uncharacterized protein n=1 Tax=uncultured Cytophagales bacterium TaxID=158755 RepID=A0A6J4IMZ4_9SPHI|nr:MAG: hypothetical protein AVDCRST_MAG56-2223 [uncultured Cytophagales bacterium]
MEGLGERVDDERCSPVGLAKFSRILECKGMATGFFRKYAPAAPVENIEMGNRRKGSFLTILLM